jgi:hypothetical protein
MGLMQALYWFAFICLLLFSWSRSRGILHPHFMFCAMLFILASDFMIRGQDDQNLQGILESSLTRYQLVTLATLIAIGISTAIVRKPYELGTRITQPEMRASANTALVVVLGALFVFLVHSAFRLNAVGWSIEGLLDQMLGPRDTRLWDQAGADGTRNPVYQLFNGMMPLVAIAFAFVLFARHTVVAIIAGLFFALTLFILITDGSRTQAIIPMASLAIFGLISLRGFVARAALLAGVTVLIVSATSAMILFRAQGFEGSSSQFALTYHQDDSIYRVWSAAAYADFSNYRWDPLYFFYYVISLPIPRTLWEGKPLLTEDFYGGFKLWWTTTTFMGEWVSMLGVWLGFMVSFVFGNLLYRGFYFAHRLLNYPFGLPAYLLVALYTYMIMRSMPNLTIFIFAPAAALIVVWLARRTKRQAPLAGPAADPAWSN